MEHTLKIAMAQIAPVWLNKEETLKKIEQTIIDAGKEQCELIVFGEGLIPGYPFWLALTGGAEWDKKVNKELHRHYVSNAVTIENGDLDAICQLAKQLKIKYIYLISLAIVLLSLVIVVLLFVLSKNRQKRIQLENDKLEKEIESKQLTLLVAFKEHLDNREEKGYFITDYVIDEFIENN